jgi:hypothetical protein
MGWGNATPLLPYGKQLTRHRQMLQQFFSPDHTSNYQHMQMKAAIDVLKDLSCTPEAYEKAFAR